MTRQQKFGDYDGFVEKFKPKKTTDDCYTPHAVYEAVKNWACKRYGIDPEKTVRPFYPGGDYENFDYPGGVIVLDNPPFSALTKIVEFYREHKIDYFLFAPELTSLHYTGHGAGVVYADANIVYENGAEVKTAFITSLGENVIEVAPDLRDTLEAAQKSNKPKMPKYDFPDEMLTTKSITYLSRHGVPFTVKRDDAAFIRNIDSMRKAGKSPFGGALLLAEKAAAEKAAAEKAAAEKAAAVRWGLSEKEKRMILYLDEQHTR